MADLFNTFFTSLIAGGCAGCAVDLVLFPLDAIKTRLMANATAKLELSKIYKGLSMAMAASFPCAATFWASYCSMKWILENYASPSSPTMLHFLSAIFGSACTACVRNPFEVVKSLMQVGAYKSVQSASQGILKTKGPSGFYVGLLSLIYREIPFDAMQMIIYEYLKGSDYGGSELSLYRHLINGAVAGGFSAFVTTPIDVAKVRIQTDKGEGKYRSFLQTIKLIYKTEGLPALWSSWKIRVIYITVGGMMFFGTYEAVKAEMAIQV
ncbi:unnamed protein product [Blepharisma stoltei]|uniref:Mitochondrial carrier protein n=1 Tax=Blepharisma stoltei TaxID=1481888 RepID=A0AAU9IG21_9CILI|nr:unnamed protein product [Blepharisma stoltei]